MQTLQTQLEVMTIMATVFAGIAGFSIARWIVWKERYRTFKDHAFKEINGLKDFMKKEIESLRKIYGYAKGN